MTWTRRQSMSVEVGVDSRQSYQNRIFCHQARGIESVPTESEFARGLSGRVSGGGLNKEE